MNILQEADKLTSSDRQKEYGHPKENFPRVAALWSAILGVEVTAGQVIDCLILLKVARAAQGYKRDTYVDIAGYARCRERVEDPADVANKPLVDWEEVQRLAKQTKTSTWEQRKEAEVKQFPDSCKAVNCMCVVNEEANARYRESVKQHQESESERRSRVGDLSDCV